jgi:glycosyltransferase involved in cell wall biosynthesis
MTANTRSSTSTNENASVTIDVRMARHAGIGSYIRNLVPRVVSLRPQWRFTLLTSECGMSDWARTPDARLVKTRSDIYSVAEQLELPRLTPRGTDLFWSPHYNIPFLSRAPLVVTVHDLAHLALPQFYGGTIRTAYARAMFGRIRKIAREVIFVSQFSADEFSSRIGKPRHATVIHNAVGDEWRPSEQSEASPHPNPYILFVGSAKPHKNLQTLIGAFERLAPEIPHDLVLIGSIGGIRTTDNEAVDRARSGPAAKRIVIIENASDLDVRRYMSSAVVLVHPSIYEGFGLPPLEAMAVGCPCLVARAASLPEVCGDAAAYFRPADSGDLEAHLRRLLNDDALRARLKSAGLQRAAQFRWDTAAAETAAVLDRALLGQV